MTQKRPDRVTGPGHDSFWDYAAKGELRLQRCTACNHVLGPVMRACDHCGGSEFSWDRMSGRGSVVSWCSFVQDYYKGLIPVPYTTILVELEEGAFFVSNPEGFGEDGIKAGMAVEVRFIDAEDAAGAFRLPVFARA